MLKAVNTEILLAILAVLLAMASTAAWRRHDSAKAAELREQREYELFRQQVEKERKKHSSAAANEGKVWQKYIP
jgi:hypothetical protein